MNSRHKSRFIGQHDNQSGVPHNMPTNMAKNEGIPYGKSFTKVLMKSSNNEQNWHRCESNLNSSSSPYTNAPDQTLYISTISLEIISTSKQWSDICHPSALNYKQLFSWQNSFQDKTTAHDIDSALYFQLQARWPNPVSLADKCRPYLEKELTSSHSTRVFARNPS
jgi:hypothetical protein